VNHLLSERSESSFNLNKIKKQGRKAPLPNN